MRVGLADAARPLQESLERCGVAQVLDDVHKLRGQVNQKADAIAAGLVEQRVTRRLTRPVVAAHYAAPGRPRWKMDRSSVNFGHISIRTDPSQGEVLRRWFEDRVLPAFDGRVLPFDLPARIMATYRVREEALLDDALIAAFAQAADMTVATRNARHFEQLDVACLNPWGQNP